MEEIPTFYPGDTISVEFSLRDDSGVSSVVAVFAHTKPGAFTYGDPTSRHEDIQLAGDGRGQPKATVTIRGKVEESTASGDYACRFVQVRNAMGNHRTFHPDPDIRFRVENGPGRQLASTSARQLFGALLVFRPKARLFRQTLSGTSPQREAHRPRGSGVWPRAFPPSPPLRRLPPRQRSDR